MRADQWIPRACCPRDPISLFFYLSIYIPFRAFLFQRSPFRCVPPLRNPLRKGDQSCPVCAVLIRCNALPREFVPSRSRKRTTPFCLVSHSYSYSAPSYNAKTLELIGSVPKEPAKGQQDRGERGAHSYLDARAKGCTRLHRTHPIIGPIGHSREHMSRFFERPRQERCNLPSSGD